MTKSQISLNLSALSLINELCSNTEKYNVKVEKTSSGATLVDAGIQADGGFLAGKIVTEICLGGYGQVKILPMQYGDVVLPSIYVQTDYPAIATLASQFAGWRIKIDDYSAIGSGPARAIALKPKKLYRPATNRDLLVYKEAISFLKENIQNKKEFKVLIENVMVSDNLIEDLWELYCIGYKHGLEEDEKRTRN